MARPKTPNTSAATEARFLIGQVSRALELVAAGWTVTPPPGVSAKRLAKAGWTGPTAAAGPDYSPTLRYGRSHGGNGI